MDSHTVCSEKILKKKFKNKLVRHPKGLPDFLIHSKNTQFAELKPNRFANGSLAGAKGRYLNKNQENTVKRLLDEGVTQIYIVYYNQKENKKFTALALLRELVRWLTT